MQLHHGLLFSTLVVLLLVPFSSSSGCGKCGTFYTAVNQTESIEAIATFCGTTVASLINGTSYNGTSVLSAGDTVQIPCEVVASESVDCGPCGIRYVCSGGENASVIADRCKIDPVQLGPFQLALPGQVVSIPCAVTSWQRSPFQCGVCGTVANVTGGQTVELTNIAGACNTNVSGVQALNPALGSAAFGAFGGSQVYVPCVGQSPGCRQCGNTYRVRQGDTFYTIAKFCGVLTGDVMMINPEAPDPYNLKIGHFLNIPCADDSLMTPSQASPQGNWQTSSLWWSVLALALAAFAQFF